MKVFVLTPFFREEAPSKIFSWVLSVLLRISIWDRDSYGNTNDFIQSPSHCLFSRRAPSWMMGEVSSMALAFHVSSSVKYAYFANYETDIAEKTK